MPPRVTRAGVRVEDDDVTAGDEAASHEVLPR